MIYICIHIFCFPLDSAIFNSQSTIKSIVKPSEPKQIADMSYLFSNLQLFQKEIPTMSYHVKSPKL